MSQWFNEDSYEAQAHARVMQAPHKAQLSHELIAAAASYEAMKAYQKHCEKNGQPASHAQAKEILAALAGAFVDRVVETKGLDFIDRQRAKHQAHQQLSSASERDYAGYERREYDPRGYEYGQRQEFEQPYGYERREFERPPPPPIPMGGYERREFEPQPQMGYQPPGFEPPPSIPMGYERREYGYAPEGYERREFERREFEPQAQAQALGGYERREWEGERRGFEGRFDFEEEGRRREFEEERRREVAEERREHHGHGGGLLGQEFEQFAHERREREGEHQHGHHHHHHFG